MNDLDRHHNREEKEDERRSDMITAEYEEICDDLDLLEAVFVKYKNDLSNVWILGRDSQQLADELISCILLEAEANADNRLSRGE